MVKSTGPFFFLKKKRILLDFNSFPEILFFGHFFLWSTLIRFILSANDLIFNVDQLGVLFMAFARLNNVTQPFRVGI